MKLPVILALLVGATLCLASPVKREISESEYEELQNEISQLENVLQQIKGTLDESDAEKRQVEEEAITDDAQEEVEDVEEDEEEAEVEGEEEGEEVEEEAEEVVEEEAEEVEEEEEEGEVEEGEEEETDSVVEQFLSELSPEDKALVERIPDKAKFLIAALHHPLNEVSEAEAEEALADVEEDIEELEETEVEEDVEEAVEEEEDTPQVEPAVQPPQPAVQPPAVQPPAIDLPERPAENAEKRNLEEKRHEALEEFLDTMSDADKNLLRRAKGKLEYLERALEERSRQHQGDTDEECIDGRCLETRGRSKPNAGSAPAAPVEEAPAAEEEESAAAAEEEAPAEETQEETPAEEPVEEIEVEPNPNIEVHDDKVVFNFGAAMEKLPESGTKEGEAPAAPAEEEVAEAPAEEEVAEVPAGEEVAEEEAAIEARNLVARQEEEGEDVEEDIEEEELVPVESDVQPKLSPEQVDMLMKLKAKLQELKASIHAQEEEAEPAELEEPAEVEEEEYEEEEEEVEDDEIEEAVEEKREEEDDTEEEGPQIPPAIGASFKNDKVRREEPGQVFVAHRRLDGRKSALDEAEERFIKDLKFANDNGITLQRLLSDLEQRRGLNLDEEVEVQDKEEKELESLNGNVLTMHFR